MLDPIETYYTIGPVYEIIARRYRQTKVAQNLLLRLTFASPPFILKRLKRSIECRSHGLSKVMLLVRCSLLPIGHGSCDVTWHSYKPNCLISAIVYMCLAKVDTIRVNPSFQYRLSHPSFLLSASYRVNQLMLETYSPSTSHHCIEPYRIFALL